MQKKGTEGLAKLSYNYETSEYEKVPVIGANVTISGGTLNEPQTEISDDEGIALFEGIEAGLYELQAVKYDTTVSVEEGVYLPKIVRLAPDYTIMLYKQTTISESDEVLT